VVRLKARLAKSWDGPIPGVEHDVLFVDDAPFVGRDVAAVETGRNVLFERFVGKQVAGQPVRP